MAVGFPASGSENHDQEFKYNYYWALLFQDQDLGFLVWVHYRIGRRPNFLGRVRFYMKLTSSLSPQFKFCLFLLGTSVWSVACYVDFIKLWQIMQQAYKKVCTSSFVWTNPLAWGANAACSYLELLYNMPVLWCFTNHIGLFYNSSGGWTFYTDTLVWNNPLFWGFTRTSTLTIYLPVF